ncbi:hypothetical protein PAGU2595_029230 [Lysobacter xanthus]
MVKSIALTATIAVGLAGCYAEGFTGAPQAARAHFRNMEQCANEAASISKPGSPKHETFMCEEKLLGFTGRQQEYVRGEPIVCAEPSDGA